MNTNVALHALLQRRTPTDGDVNRWITVVQTVGRAGTAARFLASAEFRGNAVRMFYGDSTLSPLPFLPYNPDLLRRAAAPRPEEIASWVNSGQDLLSIEVALALSSEFFVND